ncbi:MAG: DsbA family protein [Deltaproteobacteria bacterium]|nr:DsbA family protein [Deltaproteobacteria bacterium]
MRFKSLLAILMALVLIPLSVSAADMPSIKGSYTVVPGKEYKTDGKTVEVLEFLSFYCGHCYGFEKSIPVIKGNFPKKLKWKIMPIYWGESSSKPGEAYFLAEEAGKGEQMKKALFNANFVEKKDIGKLEVLEAIANDLGLGFDFSMKLRRGDKAKDAQRALEMARAYRIEETPTVIIAGNIATNSHLSGHDIKAFEDNVMTILNSILK